MIKIVFKNIERIKSALPEIIDIIMFYNNGIIYQTTLNQNLNIPKIGENLSKLVNHIQKVYDLCQLEIKQYKKLIFETDNISIIILKLGEDSNIALFFKQEIDFDKKIKSIRRYIKRIEELIDMDRLEIIFQEILTYEKEVKENQEILNQKLQNKKELLLKVEELDENQDKEEMHNLKKQIEDIKNECIKLEHLIEEKNKLIEILKLEIEKERNEKKK